jgi:hypothetical protein
MRHPILIVIIAAAALAQAPKPDWAKWWPQFQSAVAKHDAKAVAHMVQFPLDWELGKIRHVESEADFAANFDRYFPTDMIKAVATKKPETVPDGYVIIWNAGGDEYALHFKNDGKGGYVVCALSEGPR